MENPQATKPLTKRKRYRNRFDFLRAFLIKVALHTTALMPLPIAHMMGAGLGWIMIFLPNRSREIARLNIRMCFPELNQSEQENLLRSSLIEMGKTLMETGILWLGSQPRFERLVKKVDGESLLEAGLDKGKGVIIIAPHIGNWEAVGIYCAERHPMVSLYKPPKMAALDKIVRGARERSGAVLVPTDVQGVKVLYKALSENKLTGILPDQDPKGGKKNFAPFFGIQANTMVLLSRLARKTGAVPVLVFAVRLPRGKGFHMHFEAVPEGIADASLESSIQVLNQMVESLVRRYPDQYQWSYKRFNNRPEGEVAIY